MRILLRIVGAIKLFCYKVIGLNISFDKTVFFHPSAKILIKSKNSKINIGKGVCLDRNCRISINENGKIVFEDNVMVRENAYVEVGKNALLMIGKDTFFNRGITVVCMDEIEFGENVAVGNNASFFDHDHIMTNNERQNWNEAKFGQIHIGNNTWICANTLILRNSLVGNNCIVGGGVVFKGTLDNNMVISCCSENYRIKHI